MIAIDRNKTTPLADQVCDALVQLMGLQWHPLDRLPSVRHLAKSAGISVWTAHEAYQRLVARGVITARPGLGYFAAKSPTGTDALAGATEAPPRFRPDDAVGFVRSSVDPSSHALPVGTGFLPKDWMEGAIPASVMRKVLQDPRMTMPAPSHGLLEFRQQLVSKLSLAGIAATPDQIVTTFGITHATRLVCQHLLQPGDRVVIEDPCYMVQQTQLRDLGAELLAVPRRQDGPDLDALEQMAQQHRPRLVFTQSALHNPTGTSSSPSNCHKLLSLAEKYNFHIVEDDTFGDLASEATLRLAALDGFRRVTYLGSFTKVLSPALRVGFAICPPAHVDALLKHKVLGVLTGSLLEESIVSHTLKSGAYGAHINRLKRKLSKAQTSSRLALSDAGLSFGDGPSEGLFLWGKLPEFVKVDDLLHQAFREGILLTKGSLFSPSGHFQHHLRFNAAHASDPRLLALLKRHTHAGPGAGNPQIMPHQPAIAP